MLKTKTKNMGSGGGGGGVKYFSHLENFKEKGGGGTEVKVL